VLQLELITPLQLVEVELQNLELATVIQDQILFFLPLQPTVAAVVVIGVRTELLAVPAAVAAAVILQQVAQATHRQLVRPKEVLEAMAQMTQ
jgi:hypothetical protein